MKHVMFYTFLIWVSGSSTFAQVKPVSKADLLEAIKQTADCASKVLVDKDGKARCDYSLLDGQWSDYEPAWHTGQIIYGLVEAS